MLKLLMLALTITVALSIHGVAKFLVHNYLSGNEELSWSRQLMVRAAYPLITLFLVWNLKASLSGAKQS